MINRILHSNFNKCLMIALWYQNCWSTTLETPRRQEHEIHGDRPADHHAGQQVHRGGRQQEPRWSWSAGLYNKEHREAQEKGKNIFQHSQSWSVPFHLSTDTLPEIKKKGWHLFLHIPFAQLPAHHVHSHNRPQGGVLPHRDRAGNLNKSWIMFFSIYI